MTLRTEQAIEFFRLIDPMRRQDIEARARTLGAVHTRANFIALGMDVLTISRRLGHGSPSIVLGVYGHLFRASDDRAASVFEKAFEHVLTE